MEDYASLECFGPGQMGPGAYFYGGFECFSPGEFEEAKRHFENNGVGGMSGFLQEKLIQWQFIELNVGIVGESGVGKSSFINCIRGLTADDLGAAEVGTGDTTRVPTKYPHPYNQELVFWDLPGVGTVNYPRDNNYLSNVKFDRYDFFLLLSDNRFSTNDVWLAREISKKGKKFFFVRTKIDQSMESARKTEGADFSQAAILDKIKANCNGNFTAAQLPESPVYCISNYHKDMWEFGTLMSEIIIALPALKRNVMILSVGPLTKGVIKDKTKALKDRAWKVASASALGAAGASMVPIPFVGGAANVALDLVLLVNEVSFYLQQYGLDEESLKQLSKKTNATVDYYIKCLKNGSLVVTQRQTLKAAILDVIKKQATHQVEKRIATEAVRLIPFIGAVIAGGVSFGTTYAFLMKTIQELEADALAVVQAAIAQTGTDV